MKQARQEYKGHRIELRAREDTRAARFELLIDDEPIRYAQLPDGLYYLEEYAYDWRDNLIELAQRFIDFRSRTTDIRRKREADNRE